MTDRTRKALFPNPFYVVLIVASTVFTVTVFAYLISPNILQRAGARPGAGTGSVALARWLDRSGPTALGVEFIVMFVSGVLAMATDRWFPSKSVRPGPPAR